MFFTFFKLYKWCQIAQRITFNNLKLLWKFLNTLSAVKFEHSLYCHFKNFNFSRKGSIHLIWSLSHSVTAWQFLGKWSFLGRTEKKNWTVSNTFVKGRTAKSKFYDMYVSQNFWNLVFWFEDLVWKEGATTLLKAVDYFCKKARSYWCSSGVFIVTFERISQIVVVSQLLNLNK